MDRLMGLIDELRRRRVLRSAASYIVVAWLVLIILRALMPPNDLGARIGALAVYLAVAGFPFALGFSWLFRLTWEEGVVIEDNVTDEPPRTAFGRLLDLAAIAGVAIVAGMTIVRMAFGLPPVP